MADVETIDILHRHLYREPQEGDIDISAFHFKTADIMTVINRHESLQKLGDQRAIKRQLQDDLDEYAAIRARKASKRQRALQRSH